MNTNSVGTDVDDVVSGVCISDMFKCLLHKFAFDELGFPSVWLAVDSSGKTSSITMRHESNQEVARTHSSC